MRTSAVLVAIVSAGCFSEPPPGNGDDSDDGGGTTMATTGSGSGPSDSSESAPPPTSDDPASSVEASSDPTATGGVAECGNGSEEAGEPCDDGNDDDLDGCTRDCRFGPTDFTLVESKSPPPVGLNATIEHSDSCLGIGDTHALDVLTGWLGGPGDGDTWPTSLAAACRGLELVAEDGVITIGTTDATSNLADYGPPGGLEEWQLVCPEGRLPVGIRGKSFGAAASYLKSIALECAEATVVLDDGPPRVELSEALSPGYTPSNGDGDDGVSMCPAGDIAVGIQGHVDGGLPAVRSLGPVCARIELVVPPP